MKFKKYKTKPAQRRAEIIKTLEEIKYWVSLSKEKIFKFNTVFIDIYGDEYILNGDGSIIHKYIYKNSYVHENEMITKKSQMIDHNLDFNKYKNLKIKLLLDKFIEITYVDSPQYKELYKILSDELLKYLRTETFIFYNSTQ